MKKMLVIVCAALFGVPFATPVLAQPAPFPDVIPLPPNFTDEGITVGCGSTFYVGSVGARDPSTAGEILKGDLRTGEYDVFVTPTGFPAGDMHFDPRSNLLWVAGLFSGVERAYDATTGRLVAFYHLAPPHGVVNDEVITRNAVYATDTRLPLLYRIPLRADGQPGNTFEAIPMPANFGIFKAANGIVASADRR